MKDNLKIFNKNLFVFRILQKILSNKAANTELAFNNWKVMPLRMRWKLRSKIIRMSDALKNLKAERLLVCHNMFKISLTEAKLKKKKAIYIMACKFEMTIGRYFNRYHKNTMKMK